MSELKTRNEDADFLEYVYRRLWQAAGRAKNTHEP
jgi:hypothetical protein